MDQTGSEVRGVTHTDILKAYESFRKNVQTYGTPNAVIKEVERKYGSGFLTHDLGSGSGVVSLSSSTSETEVREIAAREIALAQQASISSSSASMDARSLNAATEIVRSKLSSFSLDDVSARSIKSPTISIKQDELKESIFQLALQRKAYEQALSTGTSVNPGQLAIDIEQIISDLVRRRIITTNQATEARAAGLSTVLNFSAFSGYTRKGTEGSNLAKGLSGLINIGRAEDTSRAFSSLVEPFSRGTIANVGTSGSAKNLLQVIRPFVQRNLKPADYRLDDLAVNALGNQGTVYVPTFSTTVKNVGPVRALKSAIGATTYEDAEAFSAASIASSHLVERLTRSFETFGMGLDPTQFSGPIGLYSKGFVGRRALPLFAGGVAALTVDRTIGGLVNEKDQSGERVYSPYFTTKAARGAVELQSIVSGFVPGGMTYNQKKEQLLEGEVAIKQGRFWPLGNTPFSGGKTMYYRPSYYRRLKAGANYTSESFGSPLERFAFGYDFSPLRPFDPYRFEREHYEDRPYPVTGEYFTGPWGPLGSVLNATVGKVLKPQMTMHREELAKGLSQYASAGQSGAYDTSRLVRPGASYAPPVSFGGSYQQSMGTTNVIGGAFGYGGGSGLVASSNSQLVSQSTYSLATARNSTFQTISNANANYVQASQYGPPPTPGIVAPNIIPAGPPVKSNSLGIVSGEFGYKFQEMAGIYGFGFGTLRETFGFGQSDFQPQRSVLQSASKAYGASRSFWDLNLGGLGDIPVKPEGALGNIEISEIVRRFIPKDRTDVDYINPIPNTAGIKYPFLPGSNYFTNFKQGDPYAKVAEGELRLPGIGYRRLNPNMPGYEDQLTQLDILSDIAPYSKEFRALNNKINMSSIEPGQREKLEQIRSQVADTTTKYDFAAYKYKYSSPEESGMSTKQFTLNRVGEWLAHRDTFINTKFAQNRTAQEDWERRNVYGSTFPEWQHPIESFIQPLYQKSVGRGALLTGAALSAIGTQFGKTATAKSFGAVAGFTSGFAYTGFAKAREKITGERFIPEERKKQLALEEYSDILAYTKNTALSNQARQAGDMAAAAQFSQAAKRTMYGADIYGASIDTLSLAVPKRKREHFKALIAAPVQERERILSTAPRLERRIYQAAWGMKVEERPDLVDYFSRHELPDLGWEGWHPNTNMEHVKIKMGESMGIKMSQMGYYPQQIKEANLSNPSYPVFDQGSNQQNVAAQIRMMMSKNGISGNVVPVPNSSGISGVDILSGILS